MQTLNDEFKYYSKQSIIICIVLILIALLTSCAKKQVVCTTAWNALYEKNSSRLIAVMTATGECNKFAALFKTKESLKILGNPIKVYKNEAYKGEVYAFGFGINTVFFFINAAGKIENAECLDMTML